VFHLPLNHLQHRSQHPLPLRSHYHLLVSLDTKLFVWMLDGIEEVLIQENNKYILLAFSVTIQCD
jgi:hypothetical protein